MYIWHFVLGTTIWRNPSIWKYPMCAFHLMIWTILLGPLTNWPSKCAWARTPEQWMLGWWSRAFPRPAAAVKMDERASSFALWIELHAHHGWNIGMGSGSRARVQWVPHYQPVSLRPACAHAIQAMAAVNAGSIGFEAKIHPRSPRNYCATSPFPMIHARSISRTSPPRPDCTRSHPSSLLPFDRHPRTYIIYIMSALLVLAIATPPVCQ